MPDEMTLLVSDYSALEVVILADLCKRLFGDNQLAEAVAPGAPDIHVVNAKRVFGEFLKWTVPKEVLIEGVMVPMADVGRPVNDIPNAAFKNKDESLVHPYGAVLRGMIKAVFYGFAYGKRGYGFSTLEGADGKPIGEQRGDMMVAGLLYAMPSLKRFEEWVMEFVNEWHGIYSLGGRWCDLAELMTSGQDWMRRRAYRRALNYPCQASGADIIGDAMVRVVADKELKDLQFATILNVHDELVMRGPLKNVVRAKELLTHHMVSATANGTKLLIPLSVSAGHAANYYDAK